MLSLSGFSLSIGFLINRLSSGSGYSASVSSCPLSSRLRLTVASPVRPFCFRFFGFPRSFRPDFSCPLSRFFVLGFLFVSFHPSQFRSHSCSTGASLLLSPSGFSLPFLLSFVRFCSGSDYSASVSSFPLSSRFCLTVASPVLPLRFRFLGFPRSFQPDFSCFLSRFFVLGFLFVSFHPSWLRSHSCSTSASLLLSLSGHPLSICFLSSASLPVLTTQPLFLPFLFLPVSASQWLFFGASLPLSLLWFSPFFLT